MKKAIIILAISWLGFTSYQDAMCMQECLNEGHMYGYCKRICSY